MDVQYTSEWYHWDKENEAAKALIDRGCVIIGQHADSTGAPSACEDALKAGTTVYSVGYNIDMLPYAPTAALVSPTNEWHVCYEEMFRNVMAGNPVPANWAEGLAKDAVALTELGSSCAAGTAEKLAEVEAALRDGSLKVFDTATFTVNGEAVTTAQVDLSLIDFSDFSVIFPGDTVECIVDGAFDESTFRSAPYFALRIDGITEDAE